MTEGEAPAMDAPEDDPVHKTPDEMAEDEFYDFYYPWEPEYGHGSYPRD